MSVVIFSVSISVTLIVLADLLFDFYENEVYAAVCGAILPMIVLSVFAGDPVSLIIGIAVLVMMLHLRGVPE